MWDSFNISSLPNILELSGKCRCCNFLKVCHASENRGAASSVWIYCHLLIILDLLETEGGGLGFKRRNEWWISLIMLQIFLKFKITPIWLPLHRWIDWSFYQIYCDNKPVQIFQMQVISEEQNRRCSFKGPLEALWCNNTVFNEVFSALVLLKYSY